MGERSDLSPEHDDLTNLSSLSVNYSRVEVLKGNCVNKSPGCQDQGAAGREAACPALDTIYRKGGHVFRAIRTRANKRLYSRVMIGLLIPGRYYFLTLTSAPDSPSLERSWDAWRKWLKRYRPGIVWIYCFTDEGHGVIHMVVRLGMRSKMMKHKEISDAWLRIHKASVVVIKPVKNGTAKTLANYIADQRKLRGLGSEMSYQQTIMRWRWCKGWIPKGFMQKFGKFWYQWNASGFSSWDRDNALKNWVREEYAKG